MAIQDRPQAAAGGSSQAEDSALELFQAAAMLLGDEQQAVAVVEDVVAGAGIDPCADPALARGEARERVIRESLKRMGKSVVTGLDASVAVGSFTPGACIEDDDLSAAGLTTEQLEAMLQGPGRARLRLWLDRLSPAMRAVFVLRALLGRSNDSAAEDLRASGSAGSEGWNPAAVSQVFRQALCSLATSLLHSSGEV
jgi:hypothetical protein